MIATILRSSFMRGLLAVAVSAGFLVANPSAEPSASFVGTEVNPETLRGHVEKLAEDFHPRNYREIDNLNRTADYIAAHFRKAGASVTFQNFNINGNTYRNVIGRFEGSNDSLFVVGGHYDSQEDTPGADDNASGVAGLIELAYLVGGETGRSGPTLEFVAYTLEEPPFFNTEEMGSFHHAGSLHERKIDVEGMIALEMIGYFSDEPNSQSFPSDVFKQLYPSQGNFIGVVGKMDQMEFTRRIKLGMQGATPLPVCSLNAPEALPGISYSDHRNYWNFDYPAVMITDTAFFRNPYYHEKGDVPETLDYQRMAYVVVAAYNYIVNL